MTFYKMLFKFFLKAKKQLTLLNLQTYCEQPNQT